MYRMQKVFKFVVKSSVQYPEALSDVEVIYFYPEEDEWRGYFKASYPGLIENDGKFAQDINRVPLFSRKTGQVDFHPHIKQNLSTYGVNDRLGKGREKNVKVEIPIPESLELMNLSDLLTAQWNVV